MISSGNHIDANVLASFHINGAKLFWKSRMFSTRMERSVPLEDDTPSESDKFEKDSDSDEPLDLGQIRYGRIVSLSLCTATTDR